MQPRDALGQRRLSAAALAEQRKRFAGIQRQGNVLKDDPRLMSVKQTAGPLRYDPDVVDFQ